MTADLRGLELDVEKLVPGGDALARVPDGQVLLLRGAAPGDRVRLLAVEKQRGALRALDFELVRPSPDRVTPECPVAASCGGCDLMHLSRESELAHKASMLRDALERVAGVVTAPGPLATSGDSVGYHLLVYYFPKTKVTIAVIVNSDRGPISGFPFGATYLGDLYMTVVNPYFGTNPE